MTIKTKDNSHHTASISASAISAIPTSNTPLSFHL